jgi:hypothetical protein
MIGYWWSPLTVDSDNVRLVATAAAGALKEMHAKNSARFDSPDPAACRSDPTLAERA